MRGPERAGDRRPGGVRIEPRVPVVYLTSTNLIGLPFFRD